MRTVQAMLRMDGRVALVTGGAGHLGRAFAEALLEAGARVVLVDRDAEACRARALEVAQKGQASGLGCDLSDARAIPELLARVLDEHGRLDVLVNNAAYTGASGLPGYAVPLAAQTVEAWRAALDVNLTAPFALALAAREALVTSGTGAIVNVSSIYGRVGPNLSLYEGTAMGNPAAYGASKGGLEQLTRHLATALAPSVRVNAIAPGGILRGQPETFRRKYEALTPMGRMATEEDFKAAALYLASDASAYVTGQVLVVDGGFTAW
jgi:NAD(P)-dependent dehydrogenase (short-subunit alcohol dehydrogenase family)